MSSSRRASAENTTQLFVRSNIHMANLNLAIKKNLHLQKFIDVTLSCDGRKFKCHRLILAASSPLFENLFYDNPAQHPIVIIPFGIKAWALQALIEFMYKGHVNVSQCGLQDLIRSAELLRITGLENARKDFSMDCYNQNNNSINGHSNTWTYLDNKNDAEEVTNTPKLSPALYEYDDVDLDLEDDCKNDNIDDEVVNSGVDTDHCASFEIASDNSKYEDDAQCRDKHFECDDDVSVSTSIPEELSADPQLPLKSMQRKAVGKIRVKSSEMLLKLNNAPAATTSDNDKRIFADIQSVKREEEIDLGLEKLVCHPNVSYICPNSPVRSSQYALNTSYEFNNVDDDIHATAKNTMPIPTSLWTASTTGILFDIENEIKVVAEKCKPVVNKVAAKLDQYQQLQDQQKQNQQQHDQQQDQQQHDQQENFQYQQKYQQQHQQLKVKAYKKQFYDHLRRQLQLSTNTGIGNIATPPAVEPKLKPKQFHISKRLAPNRSSSSASQIASKSLTTSFKSSIMASEQQHVGIMVMSEPSVDTVVLRSPRSNQPRNYSTQALYNALMAVKHGESIYRASREHHVPRKTLRNWMKRWNIKSQFPMPKQLKDAAIRKKISDSNKIHSC